MVEIDGDGYARISKPTPEPITRRQAAPAVYSLSPSVFAIRRSALWAYEHWSESRFEVFVIPRERAVDIDTELDFQFVRFLLEKNACKT
jgi:CMP-N,N'-diacetyllegionaminic acid synthase